MDIERPQVADRLWQFTERQLHAEFEKARKRVLDRARCPDVHEREVTRRLLWAPQRTHAALFAWLTPELGFPTLSEGPGMVTERLQFVHQFVGYELLDDGDPGALWVRCASTEDHRPGVAWTPWIPTEPHAEDAWEIITPYRESHCRAYYLDAYLTPERVVSLLDAHEARNAESVRFHRDDGAADEDLGDLIRVDDGTLAIREWMAQEDILPTTGGQWR